MCVFRGDVWDVRFPAPIGQRPCVVVTTKALVPRLGAITVAEVTGTQGPATTHVELDPAAGLTGRPRSFVNVTGLHTVAKGKLRRYRGRLAPPELSQLAEALKLYLDLE